MKNQERKFKIIEVPLKLLEGKNDTGIKQLRILRKTLTINFDQ
jgi:hypothetical protein